MIGKQNSIMTDEEVRPYRGGESKHQGAEVKEASRW